MQVEISFPDSIPTFSAGGEILGALAGPGGRATGLVMDRRPVTFQAGSERMPGQARYTAGGWEMRDSFERLPNGTLHITREWTNLTGSQRAAALVFELHRPAPPGYTLVPAVSYNGNPWGGGSEPKGLLHSSGQPWVFGGDRTSIPACTITQSAGWDAGLYTLPEWAARSACSLLPAGRGPDPMVIQQIWWPLQELPELYARRDSYHPGIYQELDIGPGETVAREACIIFARSQPGSRTAPAVFDTAWEHLARPIPASHSPEKLWALGLRFANETLWLERPNFSGFALGKILNNREWRLPGHNLAEIGWCGQNGTYACMLLQEYLNTGDEEAWRRGALALDSWLAMCLLPNGLMYTRIEDGWSKNPAARLEICNLGGAAYSYLLAAELAERAGRSNPSWLAAGLGICDFFTRSALPDGRFGRYWASDGSLIDPEGTVGSWMAWPLLKAYRMTGREEYLAAAKRGFQYYVEHDLAQACITAGALDTDCIDKEGAFPLLMAGIELYEITCDESCLHAASQAAAYLATWQWHYNLSYPPGSAADQTGYQTLGGTSVSVQHHHLDPWGALIALGWLRLGKITRSRVWMERGAAAWRQASWGVSDGRLAIHGITRPPGAQDEGFYHTRWGGSPGEMSNWLVAWPGAFRLFTLQQWDDWKALETD